MSTAYFISTNNRKEDGSIRTIMASLELEREGAIHMPSKMALYPSLESIKLTEGYQGLLKNNKKGNVFFQSLDLNTYEFLGLYDEKGRMLVNAKGQRIY
jgi:hypothetical protein